VAKAKETQEPKASKRKPSKPADKPSSRQPKTKKAAAKAQEPETDKQKNIPFPFSPFCSFCGKSAYLRKRLIAGPSNIFICDECIEVCVDILLDEEKNYPNDDVKLEWAKRMRKILSGKKSFKIEDVKNTAKGVNA